ncbi:MAG: molybdopterin-dependent oxidoreductase [Ignavibacteriaceae bacterium]
MGSKISRRSFLKIGGTGAAIGLSPAVSKTKAAERIKPQKVERIPSVCEQCFWRCGIIGNVVDGRLISIEGNPLNPNNRGKICARGNAGVALLYETDRLKNPMIRSGERGSGKWKEVSWKEALDYTSEKLLAVAKKYGVESNALFSHGASAGFINDMYRFWGSPNNAAPSFAQCRGSRDVGYELTFGETLGSPERIDLGNSKVIVLIGSALGENIHTGQIIDFTNGLARGAQLISVDPRFSTAASKAKWWLPIKPGTDTALVLAWINIIIKAGGYDKNFVNKSVTGFQELKEHVKSLTPEWAEKITEIPSSVILETAQAMMDAKPSVLIHPGRHVAWYGNDVQRARSMAILSAILGTWGQRGGYFLKSDFPTQYNALNIPDLPTPKKERVDGVGYRYPFANADEGLTQELVKATLKQEPYPIKSWMVFGQNIFNSIPDKRDTKKAIDKLDFYAVVDVRPTEPTWYADVILPEDTYLERYDALITVTGWYEQYVSLRQPLVKRVHNTRPGWWIAKELGKRLGLSAFYPYDDYEEVIKYQLKDSGISFGKLKKDGVVTFPAKPYLDKGESYSFKTNDKKVHLYSKELKELGFDPLPLYQPVNDPPKGYFRLVYGVMPVHSHGKTESNPWLNTLISEPHLWINETIARSMNLKNEDEVIVENQDGIKSDKIKLLTTPGMRPDAVFLPHGFGGNEKGLLNYTKRNISDNRLISKYNVDPISGGTGLRVNFVRIIVDDKILIPSIEVSMTGVSAKKISGIQHKEEKRIFHVQPKKKEPAIREGC